MDVNSAAYGDDTVTLYTDQYTIYDDIDEHDEIDGHWPLIATIAYLSVMRTSTTAKTDIDSFAIGSEGSERSQNITCRAT